jgi:hypothetical protein
MAVRLTPDPHSSGKAREAMELHRSTSSAR